MRLCLIALALIVSGCLPHRAVDLTRFQMSRDQTYMWAKVNRQFVIITATPNIGNSAKELHCGVCTLEYRGTVWVMMPLGTN